MVACISTSFLARGQRPVTRASSHMPSRQYVGAANCFPECWKLPPVSQAHGVSDVQ